GVLLVQQLLRLLGLGAGHLELVVGLALERRGKADDENEDEQPCGEDAAAVIEAPAAESVQVRSHGWERPVWRAPRLQCRTLILPDQGAAGTTPRRGRGRACCGPRRSAEQRRRGTGRRRTGPRG